MGRLGRACQLLSPKGVLFFNFFILSHVVTICTFSPILVDLLELFFGPSNHCHELCTLYTRKLILYISFCTIFQFLEHIVSDYLFLIMLLLLLLNHYVRFSQFLLTFLGKYFNASYRNASGVI